MRAGYAAFLFDFAHFGGSEGLPRQLADPDRQLANYMDAVKHVRVRVAAAAAAAVAAAAAAGHECGNLSA